MPRLPLAVASALLLVACGPEPAGPAAPNTPASPSTPAAPTASPTAEGAAGARGAVEAYMVAAGKPDQEAMLALGTPEWRTKETTWKKSFTLNIVKSGFALKSYEVREPELEGDKASVSVRAIFSDAGKDNGEGMRFTLERRDGRWWITDLR